MTIREMDHDRCCRTVAEVIFPDGRSLNSEMVAEGMAWWYRQYAPADQKLAGRQTDSRTANRGFRSQPNPIPPSDWRHGKNVPVTAEVIGNRKSHIYHATHRRTASVMKLENRVQFKTTTEAAEKGYWRGKDCD